MDFDISTAWRLGLRPPISLFVSIGVGLRAHKAGSSLIIQIPDLGADTALPHRILGPNFNSRLATSLLSIEGFASAFCKSGTAYGSDN